MKSTAMKRVVSLILVFAFVFTALPFALATTTHPDNSLGKYVKDKMDKETTPKISLSELGSKELKSVSLTWDAITSRVKGFFPQSDLQYKKLDDTSANPPRVDDGRTYKSSSFEVTEIEFVLPSYLELTYKDYSYSTSKFTSTNKSDMSNLSLRAIAHGSGKITVKVSVSYKEDTYPKLANGNFDSSKPTSTKVSYPSAIEIDYEVTLSDMVLGTDLEVLYGLKRDASGNIVHDSDGKPVEEKIAEIKVDAFNEALQKEYPDLSLVKIRGIEFPTKGGAFFYSTDTLVTPHTEVAAASFPLKFDSSDVTADQTVKYYATAKDSASNLINYTGTIKLAKDSEENKERTVADLPVKMNASKKAEFTLYDIANQCLKARKGERNAPDTVEIDKIKFQFSTADLKIESDNKDLTIESGEAYDTKNFATFTVTSNKSNYSDVRLYYTAYGTDGYIYSGSIVFQGLNSVAVGNLTGQYSIYPSIVTGKYDATDIYKLVREKNSNEKITSITILTASFTPAGTGKTPVEIYNSSTKTWKEQSAYGYLTIDLTKRTPLATSFDYVDSLYYIAGSTSGSVTITFQANGSSATYTGTMTYTVYAMKNGGNVTLKLKTRDPYLFSNQDSEKVVFGTSIVEAVKDAFGDKAECRYVVFDAVQSSSTKYGTLYADSNKTALSVKASTTSSAMGYYFKEPVSGLATAPVSSLYYVPTTTAGSYTQNYTVNILFNGTVLEIGGTLTITTPSDSLVQPDVLYQVTTGERVNFTAQKFEEYLKEVRSTYQFEYVKFSALPSSGALFYGTTEIKADTLANYTFYANTDNNNYAIGSLSYLPSVTNDYVTIPFVVGYRESATGTTVVTREGVLVVVITSAAVKDISYQVKASDTVYMKTEDFTSVCTTATGQSLNCVYFVMKSVSGGRLNLGSSSAVNGTTAYYAASGRTPALSNVRFSPTASTGTLTFSYDAYSTGGRFLYRGKVNVTLYAETKTPAHRRCVVSAQKMVCNGQEVSLQAYNIDDYNYLKLRDIAALLSGTASKFSIQTIDDGTKREFHCTLGGSYSLAADDLKTGADQSATCVASSWGFYVDGEYKSVYVYNIGGYNYCKLRDLGTALKFGVSYNEATNTAIITSSDYRG